TLRGITRRVMRDLSHAMRAPSRRPSRTDASAKREHAAYARAHERAGDRTARHLPVMTMGAAAVTGTAAMVATNGVGASAPTPFSFVAGIGGGFAGGVGLLGALLVLVI